MHKKESRRRREQEKCDERFMMADWEGEMKGQSKSLLFKGNNKH